jgi:hypothetical protein
MARTINEIQAEIIAAKQDDSTLSGLNSASKTAIWMLWTYVVAVGIRTLELLFDAHKKEVQDIIYQMKPHTLQWYVNVARAFQKGQTLGPDTDKYDNTGKTDSDVEASRIVTYAACVESDHELILKVAKEASGDLAPLSGDELLSFSTYMGRVKDAGVFLNIISLSPDALKLKLDIYYDPLLLNEGGKRIDGTSDSPVADAIRAYLKKLPFNGVLVSAFLIDALQQVDGVVIPVLRDGVMWCRYGSAEFADYAVKYPTDAGYIRIAADDLDIQYIPQQTI